MSEPQLKEEDVNPLETIARKGGWSPQDEWRGDPDKWKPADVFVEEGIKIQGKQHETIERLQGTVSRVEDNIQKMAKGEAQRTKKALESQKSRLEREREEAFDDMDKKKFDEVDRQLEDTNQQLGAIEEPAKKEFTPEVEKGFQEGEQAFIKENDWYGKDMVMTDAAHSLATTISTFNKNLTPEAFYEKLQESLEEKFPDEFKNPNRGRGSGVSGDRPRARGGNKKTFASLPPEAKEAFEEVAYFSKISQADYAKSYYESEEAS